MSHVIEARTLRLEACRDSRALGARGSDQNPEHGTSRCTVHLRPNRVDSDMNVPDILFEIAVRSDDAVLSALYLTSLQPWITALLQDNSQFWYVRSEFVMGRELRARPSADWKTIYYNLPSGRDTSRSTWSVWRFGFSHLDSLLVILDVHGLPETTHGWWLQVQSPQVLEYLLDSNLLERDDELAWQGLLLRMRDGNIPMFEALLGRIGRGVLMQRLSSVLDEVIDSHMYEVMKLLLSEFGIEHEYKLELAHRAIIRHDVEMVTILGVDEADADERDDLIRAAVEEGHLPMVQYLLSQVPDLTSWVISQSQTPMKWHKMVLFEALLTDERIGPHLIMLWPQPREMLTRIVTHPRLRIERLGKGDIYKLYTPNNASRGFDLAGQLTGSARTAIAVVQRLDGWYDRIIVYIMMKEPNAVDLMDWLISLDWETARQAAESILLRKMPVGVEVRAIRALLLSMLYPLMTFEDVMTRLKQDGYGATERSAAMQLVGVFMGETRLRDER